jgi:hypothetical protein
VTVTTESWYFGVRRNAAVAFDLPDVIHVFQGRVAAVAVDAIEALKAVNIAGKLV